MALQDKIGFVTKLKVVRTVDFGYFLTDGTEDVLLHKNETEKLLNIDDEVDVFLYTDHSGRITATTKTPKVRVGEYNWATVVDVQDEYGVFVDIGINKDMLLEKNDLPKKRSVWPKEGDLLYITLKVSRNNRIYVKLATDPIIDEIRIKATRQDFNKNIQGYIYRTAKIGSWVYTLEGFKGFIHESQRNLEPRLGEKVDGRIIDVKEDGTVNVSLKPRKHEVQDEDAKKIYEYLLSRNGAMPYGDKSMPEDILIRFNMSKGAFKRALGKLMKEGFVYQEKGWTYKKEK